MDDKSKDKCNEGDARDIEDDDKVEDQGDNTQDVNNKGEQQVDAIPDATSRVRGGDDG